MTLWTEALQACLPMEFPRQKYWSGLPFPPPWDLSDPGIKPVSLASPALAGRLFTIEPSGKPLGLEESLEICISNELPGDITDHTLRNMDLGRVEKMHSLEGHI